MIDKIKTLRKDSGFTIVELLIVIVVIGILAAITIVSYTGITQKANATKAQTNAVAVQKVAETFFAEKGSYPDTVAEFGSGSATLPSGVTVQVTNPDIDNYKTAIGYTWATTGGPAAKIVYFDGTTIQTINLGNTTGVTWNTAAIPAS